ncbi:MAG: hypothetical protein OXI38_09795 [Bacteroidota bacterium]|nr:hypothetical protein [Bacteroidota bacterium]
MRAIFLLLVIAAAGCRQTPQLAEYNPVEDSLRFAGEVHLRNIRQLTFGGNNAEAYWSFDDQRLIFQSDWAAINPQGCDQQFVIDPANPDSIALVSTGKGRTTCGYFLPDGRVIYASTHAASAECPPPPEGRDRYVWPIYDSFDIYVADADGSNPSLLIGGEGYDAEATVSPDGRFVVFTSTRSGDLDLWRYELATGNLLQLTSKTGYDGGAFFSRDSQRIVWRASRPQGEAQQVYQDLLAEGLVEPGVLDIFVADIDGGNVQQVTDLEGANWAPFFHPDGQRVIFASNFESIGQGRPVFALYMVTIDTHEITKVTHSNTFDAFPMFSFDGRKLVFASNRNVTRTPSRDTNLFIADWVEAPTAVDHDFTGID